MYRSIRKSKAKKAQASLADSLISVFSSRNTPLVGQLCVNILSQC